jgi:hypothetical protein
MKSTVTQVQPTKQSSGISTSAPPSLGSKIGGFLGNLAQSSFLKLLGKGDYETGDFNVEKNSIINPQQASQVPLMHSDNGCVRVKHREYIQDLRTGTEVAQPYNYAINPFNSALFPWLSNIAQNFEQYRIMGMVVEFVSNSGNAVSSTNAALGSISIATQYNAELPSFSSKRQLLNHYYAVSAAPSKNLMHAIECKDMYDPYKLYWVRTAVDPPSSTKDSRLSDYGVINIINVGSQSAYLAGELWVSYDILLCKPRLAAQGADGSLGSGYIIEPTQSVLVPDKPIAGIVIPENPVFALECHHHHDCEPPEHLPDKGEELKVDPVTVASI